MQTGAKLHACRTMPETTVQKQKLLSRYNSSFSIATCTSPAQWRSMNLHSFVNRAQCLANPVTKKQQRKQPKTKTVVIESQWQKPLTKHKN
jgi:hypothetical protein